MTAEELRLRSKSPGADTGITIKKTMCDICSPGLQCGVDAYVKDGVILKLEGTDGFPVSDGRLCAQGGGGAAVSVQRGSHPEPYEEGRSPGQRGI